MFTRQQSLISLEKYKTIVPSGLKQPIFMDIKFHQELKKMQNLFYLTNIRISQRLKIYRLKVEFIQKT